MKGISGMRKIIEYGVISHIGLVKKVNQDRILIKIGQAGSREFGLFAVADGMGGHTHGEVASTMAIAELTRWWDHELEAILLEKTAIWNCVKTSLANCFLKINEQIRTVNDVKMGTTLTVLIIYGDKYVITHIGDSRIYTRTHKHMTKVTKDHSFVDQIQQEGSRDKVHHPYGHVLTQCLGIQEHIYPYTRVSLNKKKQLFLLCSDGLYNYIRHQEMEQILYSGLRRKEELQTIVDTLYEQVLHHGAGDNVSIILAQDRNKAWRM